MTAFEQLRQLILDAEQRVKQKTIQQEFEKAKQGYESARNDFEMTQENLRQVRLEHGNFQQVYDQKSKELAVFREASVRLKDELVEEKALEQLFKQASEEIEDQRQSARETIESLEGKLKSAQEVLRTSLDQYKRLKQEIDACASIAVLPGSSPKVQSPSRDEALPPSRIDLETLLNDINASNAFFGNWPPDEQHALLSLWAGKTRQLQDLGHWKDDEEGIIKGIFGKLNNLSGTHRPGFVDALNRNFSTFWEPYISEHHNKYQTLVHDRKDREQADHDRRTREQEQRRTAEQSLEAARQRLEPDLVRMRELAVLPSDTAIHKELTEIVQRALLAMNGRLDDEDIELLFPHRIAFNDNSDFRWLRKQFDLQEKAQVAPELSKQYPKAFEQLKGKRVVIIGGSPREEVRSDLESFFQMAELSWESCQGKEPQVLERVEQRIKSRGVDVVIELTRFVGHHVETLRPVCERSGCKFIRVPRGYGRVQIAQAMQGTGN